jgi:hypothetical protein
MWLKYECIRNGPLPTTDSRFIQLIHFNVVTQITFEYKPDDL